LIIYVSGCPVLAKTEHITGHNNVAAYVLQSICKRYDMETPVVNSNQKGVGENDIVTILWDVSISTDRALRHIRPDIIVKAHTTKYCTFKTSPSHQT